MAVLSLLEADDGCPREFDKNIPIAGLDLHRFINPRQMDKRFSRPPGLTISTLDVPVSTESIAPIKSISSVVPRRTSIAPSEGSSPWRSGPSSIASVGSSPGCLTPANTNCSLPRHDPRICFEDRYHSSAPSPSPCNRPRKLDCARDFNEYTLREQYMSDDSADYSNNSSFNIDNGVAYGDGSTYALPLEAYANSVQTAWPSQEFGNILSPAMYEETVPFDTSASLGIDLVSDFQNQSMPAGVKDTSHMYKHENTSPLFHNSSTLQTPTSVPAPLDRAAIDINLDFSWEYEEGRWDSDSDRFDDEEDILDAATSGMSHHQPQPTRGYHRKGNYARTSSWSSSEGSSIGRRNSGTRSSIRGDKALRKRYIQQEHAQSTTSKRHPCEYCNMKFARPEHLSRHRKSIHDENVKTFPCVVPDCMEKDRITHKTLKARGDNLAPHYQNTHFKWGNSEKSGKNRRISLKESYELGLASCDNRWNRYLEGRIKIDVHDPAHPCEWKMLGYSIKETQEILVKQLFPKEDVPDGTTLKAYDHRWGKMIDGTMDYETAMATGNDILTKPEHGALGVTMKETEEMGIKDIDVRWKVLLNGRMSIEDSEILGVKHLNPAWTLAQEKRRR